MMAPELAVDTRAASAPAWLDPVARRGLETWRLARMPNRKTESWKYTSVRVLERADYAGVAERAEDIDALAHVADIEGLEAHRLVFVNGRYEAALSAHALPDGVTLVPFSNADSEQVSVIQNHLGKIVDRDTHVFVAQNESLLAEGAFLRVKAGVEVEKPIQVVWLSSGQEKGFTVAQRLLVVLEPRSRVTLLEHFASDRHDQHVFTNGVSEFDVGAGAHLRHYRLHLEQEQAVHIGGMHVDLASDAELDSFHLGLGGRLKRVDIVVNHRGERAACRLNGVYLPRHDQHIDYHTCIEHRVPSCTTDENFRGIIGDRARAVFNGRIHIHPDARKTRAELSNKNLLTSDQAEVDTKPELEIYTDDVQCAHGATVAQLEEQAVYYLRSRGVSLQDTRTMLSFGFINELIDDIGDEPVAVFLREVLDDMFVSSDAMAGSRA
ncbi:MAG: Fe-S cluster assembly protein SufD [Pseudomonadales bacterium]|nr:Fe-S cluster assembly protein SufD [Pseudomonadales bacterium]